MEGIIRRQMQDNLKKTPNTNNQLLRQIMRLLMLNIDALDTSRNRHTLMTDRFNIERSLAVENGLHFFQTAALGLFHEEPDQYGHYNVQRCVEEEGITAP